MGWQSLRAASAPSTAQPVLRSAAGSLRDLGNVDSLPSPPFSSLDLWLSCRHSWARDGALLPVGRCPLSFRGDALWLCHPSTSSRDPLQCTGLGGGCGVQNMSWFLLAASLRSSRRSQEQSSNHLPKLRASNLSAQCGGEFKAGQVLQLLPSSGD